MTIEMPPPTAVQLRIDHQRAVLASWAFLLASSFVLLSPLLGLMAVHSFGAPLFVTAGVVGVAVFLGFNFCAERIDDPLILW